MNLFKIADSRYFTLSILLHIGMLGFFVFQFPDQFTQTKPDFTFLGAILKNNETQVQNEKAIALSGIKPVITPKFIQVDEPFGLISNQKPKADTALNSDKRLWLKSTFDLEPPKKDEAIRKLSNDLGIDLQTPVYKPLRIRNDTY